MSNVTSIYGGRDPRELPFYTLTDVANYLRVPRSTLGAWCGRKTYTLVEGRRKRMEPLLRLDPKTKRLTFHNLVEAYVVSSLTRTFAIPLPLLRVALAKLEGNRPLLEHKFYARKGEMFIELASQVLVDMCRSPGQAVLREFVESSIERIEFDGSERPQRFHPWRESVDEPRVVSIDARHAFGRPTVSGRSLKVEVIVDLYRAGEDVATIARNYDLQPEVIESVLKWSSARYVPRDATSAHGFSRSRVSMGSHVTPSVDESTRPSLPKTTNRSPTKESPRHSLRGVSTSSHRRPSGERATESSAPIATYTPLPAASSTSMPGNASPTCGWSIRIGARSR